MNREVGKYIIVCVAVLCAVIWNHGRGRILELYSSVSDFRTLIERQING